MCYSAQIEADYRAYVKMFGADIDIKAFVELYWYRRNDPRLKLPKGMERAFADPRTDDERRIKQAIDEYKAQEATRLEQELFAQRTRLTEAERALQVKPTKAAADSQRIATDKIAKAKTRLDDLRRTEPEDRDSRIFPTHYAPVMVSENGRRVIKPMRYQCRPKMGVGRRLRGAHCWLVLSGDAEVRPSRAPRLIVLALALGLAACGERSSTADSRNPQSARGDTPVRFVVCTSDGKSCFVDSRFHDLESCQWHKRMAEAHCDSASTQGKITCETTANSSMAISYCLPEQ